MRLFIQKRNLKNVTKALRERTSWNFTRLLTWNNFGWKLVQLCLNKSISSDQTWECSYRNIYILSVVALDETNIFGFLHFSMQNIELSCDLHRPSRRRNINVSQWHFLFIDACVTSFTYGHNFMFMNFTPWLFQHLRYKWNILFYKDNWRGWVEENLVNLIDDIECRNKETWCVHTIGMHCSSSSSSYCRFPRVVQIRCWETRETVLLSFLSKILHEALVCCASWKNTYWRETVWLWHVWEILHHC